MTPEVVTDALPGSASVSAAQIDGDRRDLRLDACRGLALWFIFVDHIPNNSLTWLTLRNYGFSDTSEVFVFVSGYTCMLAYGGALPQEGWLTIVTRALRRELAGNVLLRRFAGLHGLCDLYPIFRQLRDAGRYRHRRARPDDRRRRSLDLGSQAGPARTEAVLNQGDLVARQQSWSTSVVDIIEPSRLRQGHVNWMSWVAL
jgi:hypothetical protein